ncbi:MAG: class I SAM-dependent methyltransferase [Chthoniobacterales bacterium]|nr:class I SAM-dependent methyltransferase [Chthoniobacterales bacterium]
MSEDVRAFFANWDIYKLCLEHNTLHHREVGEILRTRLLALDQPFSFLDLACGDAEVTAEALAGSRVNSYTGVDYSAPAIALAVEKTSVLHIPRKFHEQDFTLFLRANTERFDVVYLGLSLHHLEKTAKREMMGHVRRAVIAGGAFYLFEPILHGGESREGYVERWSSAMNGPYDAFPPAARDALREHVRISEIPEAPGDYLSCAIAAGFSPGETLFTDPGNFYSLFRFIA